MTTRAYSTEGSQITLSEDKLTPELYRISRNLGPKDYGLTSLFLTLTYIELVELYSLIGLAMDDVMAEREGGITDREERAIVGNLTGEE